MLISILAMGGTIIGATAIAGLLMAYQIRQSADLAGSAKAIGAADAGLECSLYMFFQSTSSCPGLPATFQNGSTVTFKCYTSDGQTEVSCSDQTQVYYFRVQGVSGNISRSIEAFTGF